MDKITRLRLVGFILTMTVALSVVAWMYIRAPKGEDTDSSTQIQEPHVLDDTGTQVLLSPRPERIVSLAPGMTELLFALEVGDRVVGVTSRCDYPLEVQSKAKVGDVLVSLESLFALEPDLVLADSNINKSVVEKLRDRGLRVAAFYPEDLAGLYSVTDMIGTLVDAESAANDITAQITRAVHLAASESKSLQEKPRVLVLVQTDPPWAAGEDTLLSELLIICGAQNCGASVGGYAPVSREQILMWDPDALVLVSDESKISASDPLWRELRAAREGAIYHEDPDVFVRAGPRTAQALQRLSEIVLEVGGAK